MTNGWYSRWILIPARRELSEVYTMLDHCPGAANLRTPTLSVRKCPQCGGEVEVFSSDVSVTCSTCGFVVYNDIMTCVRWCKYARECVGEDTYAKIMAQAKAQEAGKQLPERK